MPIKLYSTHCPRCNVLESKLKQKNVEFQLVENFDTNELLDKGFSTVPVLVIDDKYMDFTEAVKWVNEV